ncbi:hypothetical protein L596_024699 [Steinernema carpocapsae]|uniref:Uncharacterized protein n=1 Tax=Steinernema carpocapsae TaxID=34508 RepID=A0A4U5M6E9_STECR|nr:hypothetical protein L596_024699 [Steinernema carpocapsae]
MFQRSSETMFSKHFCCCGCVNVKTGTKVIAWLDLAWKAISLLAGIASGVSYVMIPSVCISVTFIVLTMFALMGVSQIEPDKIRGLMYSLVGLNHTLKIAD